MSLQIWLLSESIKQTPERLITDEHLSMVYVLLHFEE
jgi:hypothetical protein